MPPQPDLLYAVCRQLLTAVEAHHGGTLPVRRYVSAGPPPWDGELLSVWCETTSGYEGNPAVDTAVAHGPGFAMRVGTFVISTARCTPAVPESKGGRVQLPSVAQEEEAAQAHYGDAQRITSALVTAAKADELPGCHSIVLLGWTGLEPQGGYVGGDLRVRVGLVRGA